MAKCYSSTPGSNASGSSVKTIITVIASTSVRPRIYDYTVGSSQTPADQAWQVNLGRFTAAGTAGNSPTALPLDNQDVAAICTVGNAHSAPPTYTAGGSAHSVSGNQRMTYRWVASPGSEVLGAASSANGVGLYLNTATAAMVLDGLVLWIE